MSDESTYRMELQYDGSDFHGWAKQDGLSTVEGILEQAFTTLLGRPPSLRVAGRTDAGVHARRQVASFRSSADVDTRRLLTSLNALTPPAITVVELAVADEGFDARGDVLTRAYRYQVQAAGAPSPFHRQYSWWLPQCLDLEAMSEAASFVRGGHDFMAFTPTETEHKYFHRSVLRSDWAKNPEGLLVFEIEAESFLRHMVRALVGTMVEVGLGKRRPIDLHFLLEGARREAAGLTAPARGLFLWDIKYPPGV